MKLSRRNQRSLEDVLIIIAVLAVVAVGAFDVIAPWVGAK